MIYTAMNLKTENSLMIKFDYETELYKDKIVIRGKELLYSTVESGKIINFNDDFYITDDITEFTIGQIVQHPVMDTKFFIMSAVEFEDKEDIDMILGLWENCYLDEQIEGITSPMVLLNNINQRIYVHPSKVNILPSGTYKFDGFVENETGSVRPDIKFLNFNKDSDIILDKNTVLKIGQSESYTYIKVSDIYIKDNTGYYIVIGD